MADASQVHQVITNLATNAWHAIGDRPGTVTIDVGIDSIETSHMRTELPPGRYVRIDVTDTGNGISGDVLERIFEPFFTTSPGVAEHRARIDHPHFAAGVTAPEPTLT